jgi:CheY-like chemotaxis protein
LLSQGYWQGRPEGFGRFFNAGFPFFSKGRPAQVPIEFTRCPSAPPSARASPGSPIIYSYDYAAPIALIVDDVQINRKLPVKSLAELFNIGISQMRRIGTPFHEAKNGEEALAQFRKAIGHGPGYKFIIMDYEMPLKNGAEAAKGIRELERKYGRPPVPIFAYTSHADAIAKARFREANVTQFLSKPLQSVEELRTILSASEVAIPGVPIARPAP